MSPRFNGPKYIDKRDRPRLQKQHERVRDLMLDFRWRTLQEISDAVGAPAASVSAQLRHLRKPRFGSYLVELRLRGADDGGLYEYRVTPSKTPQLPLPPTTVDIVCPRCDGRGRVSKRVTLRGL